MEVEDSLCRGQRRSSRVLQRQISKLEAEDEEEIEEENAIGRRAARRSLPRTLGWKRGSRAADGAEGQGLPKAEVQRILAKRQKNKEAAARCRQKKIDTIKSLEKVLEVST